MTDQTVVIALLLIIGCLLVLGVFGLASRQRRYRNTHRDEESS